MPYGIYKVLNSKLLINNEYVVCAYTSKRIVGCSKISYNNHFLYLVYVIEEKMEKRQGQFGTPT